jgi:hypothetical protein
MAGQCLYCYLYLDPFLHVSNSLLKLHHYKGLIKLSMLHQVYSITQLLCVFSFSDGYRSSILDAHTHHDCTARMVNASNQ